MKFKNTILSLIFTVIFLTFSHAQETPKECSCLRLPENEENDQKVAELAQYIETSFNASETTGFNKKFDVNAFTKAIGNNEVIDMTDEYTKGFMKGIRKTGSELSKKIVAQIEAGAYYNLVNYRYIIEEKAYYFTFRLYSNDTGVNYHDYKVCSDGETVKFNDIYIYLTGEKLSETLQRLFIFSLPSQNPISRLIGTNSSTDIVKISESRKLALAGKAKEAYEKIDEIKGPMAKEKFILIIKGSYASNFDDKIYEEALEEFAELYPNDPTLYLKQVDYYILKENYKKAIENIDILIDETGDDFLNLVKANTYYMNNDYANAENSYAYMTVNYPDLFEAYIGQMVCLNYQNRFEDALNIVKELLDQGYDRDALLEFLEEKETDGSNELDAFVSSKIYKQWKRQS